MAPAELDLLKGQMTPADLSAELAISAKTVRAFLRRKFPRHTSEYHSDWLLTDVQVAAARAHFGGTGLSVRSEPIRRVVPAPSPITSQIPNVHETVPTPLRSYLRPGLDVLFVALNPPTQSANNGHWFSGSSSCFFKLLYKSGLITANLPRANADELVFGSTQFNYKNAHFGVTDLRPDHVETDSSKVDARSAHVRDLVRIVHEFTPRIVCVIHYKVRDAFNAQVGQLPGVVDAVILGEFTQPLTDCKTRFIFNNFPNGNRVSARDKIEIFSAVRDAI